MIQSHSHPYFVQEGAGQPVILVHGYAGSHRQWRFLIPALAAEGYQVYAPDLAGHGLSPKHPAGRYHIESLTHHFTAWVESLHLSAPPVLVGHSLGASVSLGYSLTARQAPAGLFFASPFFTQRQLRRGARLSLDRPEVSKAVLRLAPEWTIRSALRLSDPRAGALPRPLRRMMAEDYKRLDPETVHLPQTVCRGEPRLDEIRAPTMVVWGEGDQTLTPDAFPSLCNSVPHAWTRVLPGGHLPHLTHPDLFNRTVLEFLALLRNPRAAPGEWKFCPREN